MRWRVTLSFGIGCLLSIVCFTLGGRPQAEASTICKQPPIEPCVVRHGRFSTQNGITQTIWLIGTNRRVSVTNDTSDFLPAAALKYTELTSPEHSYIFGDFTICPIEPESVGQIRGVCVAAAKNLVVERVDKSQPPFRIPSTWST